MSMLDPYLRRTSAASLCSAWNRSARGGRVAACAATVVASGCFMVACAQQPVAHALPQVPEVRDRVIARDLSQHRVIPNAERY